MTKIAKSFGTHSGSFHADEVTACALLCLFDLIDKDKIFRTRDPSVLSQCEFVCDVGGEYDPSKKIFDHHQVEYEGLLSSAGMILRFLRKEGVIGEKLCTYFHRAFIHGVDLHDNGKEPEIEGFCSFSHVISNYNPIVHSSPPEKQDEKFMEALEFTIGHCERLVARFTYIQSCKEKVEAAMNGNPEYLLFDESIPWLEPFFELGGENHPARFVVMPSGIHWKLRGIPPSFKEKMKVRTPLPKEWMGLHEEELRKVTGIQGAIFCHKGRFISVWERREDAMQALSIVLKNSGG